MGSGAGKNRYNPNEVDERSSTDAGDFSDDMEKPGEKNRGSLRSSRQSEGSESPKAGTKNRKRSLAGFMMEATSMRTHFGKGEEMQEFQPHVDFLRLISSSQTDLDTYVNTIISEVIRVLNAERCSVFFVDDIRKEVCCVGALGVEPFTMPWDRGIVGASARCGKLMNIQDAHSHTLFDNVVERSVGYVTNTILSLPIKHMIDEDRAVGVLQVLNKCGGPDAVFSKHDESQLAKLAMVIADSFYRQRWRALENGARNDKEALAVIAAHSNRNVHKKQSLLPSFGGPDGNDALQPFVRPGRPDSRDGRNSVGSYALDNPVGDNPGLGEDSVVDEDPDVASPAILQVGDDEAAVFFRRRDFDVLSYQADELVPVVTSIFNDTTAAERCAVPPDYLRNWSWAVRRLYRDNPYHNWFHGFSVFHQCYYQVLSSNVFTFLRFIDVFGLLVAALCHDVDHPGVTNGFLVEENHELALRYNDQSVLENHHAHLACELLRKEETSIACGLERAEQQHLRRTIIRSILATDMICHNDQCQSMLNRLSADTAKEADRQFWLSNAIHTADLAGQAMPWNIAVQWEERVSTEFQQQANKEREMGLTPAPFMQFQMDDMQQRGKLQRNFIDFVLLPLWDPYTQLLPQLRPCFDNLLENRELYDKRANPGQDEEP